MDYAEAKALIIREGASENGIVVETRFGPTSDIGERIAAIRRALHVVDRKLNGQQSIDRDLAYAIFELGHQLFLNLYVDEFDSSFDSLEIPDFVGDLEQAIGADVTST